ncbi:MAG: hypothetical protein A2029_13840 [Chloroflexi bacterium RBG_19FT_COMBO_47_9]|nr:MAG: hypothetical protein A2029_13840 [Chloroflexi bacterium RBG_19FT_COMBO_47_9]
MANQPSYETVYFQSANIKPYPLDVVGESSYKEHICSFFSELDLGNEDGVDKDDFLAKLILEDQNSFDSKAVRIDIENKTVGYLSRANARLYRQRLIEYGSPAITGICIASIQGGHQIANGVIADFDVYLDLDLTKPLKKIVPNISSSENIPTSTQIQKSSKGIFKSKKTKIIIAITGIVFLCCIASLVFGSILNSTPSGKATSTAIAEIQQVSQTEEARPTNTILPSDTPEPSNTPRPSNTPKPTSTPVPTHTPAPTDTPTIPPTPIVLSGTGDSIVDIEKGSGPVLVHIVGNASSRHFAVKNIGSNNDVIDLLVNTTDPYDGIRPMDFLDGEHTYRFEVTATGGWSIEVLPLSTIHKLEIPGEITGQGDYVFAVVGGTPDTAIISGNSASRHFAVKGYSDTVNLLVNTTDPYNGTVLLDSGTIIIEVDAESEWTIKITTR